MARAAHRTHQTLALLVAGITSPVYFDLIRGAERVAAGEESTMIAESGIAARARVIEAAPAVDGVVLVGSRLPMTTSAICQCEATHHVNRAVAGIRGDPGHRTR